MRLVWHLICDFILYGYIFGGLGHQNSFLNIW